MKAFAPTHQAAWPPKAWPHLFISHGAPDMALNQGPHALAWEAMGDGILHTPAPPALLLVSAHRQSRHWDVHTGQRAAVVHDYGGFDPALRQVRYDIAIDPAWTRAVADALSKAGLAHDVVPVDRPEVDHGLWVPLSRMWPGQLPAPAVLLSIPVDVTPAELWQAGRALAGLAGQGLRIVGSGSLTHPLPWVFRGHPTLGSAWTQQDDTPPDQEWPESRAFRQWVMARMQEGDRDALLQAQSLAPAMSAMHPTPEHWWPLLLTAAMASASDAQWPAPTAWHEGVCLGGLSMDALVWEP